MSNARVRIGWKVIAVVAAGVALLPLFGHWRAGGLLGPLLAFPPPLVIPSNYPRFSWVAVSVLLVAAVVVVGALYPRRRQVSPSLPAPQSSRVRGGAADPRSCRSGRFPPWGGWAIGWTLLWWALAWTRFDGFAPAQRYTFFPLWLGFIVTVNALAVRRHDTCLMTRAPGRWLALFGASALFWWGFEWLNRFVRNWHYLGVQDFEAPAYALHGSLCFSTVLPAVAGVREWLGHDRPWQAVFAGLRPWPSLARPGTGMALVILAAAALVLLGARPVTAYPALWLAPLMLAVGLVLCVRADWLAPFARGDWRSAAAWGSAALVCGFFWELWNLHSFAKWIYTVPYVERWHVFEMPLLGYGGYIPFGLACGLVVTWITGPDPEDTA